MELELKEIGDRIANLTVKQAKELSDYLKYEYDIEPPAAGGTVIIPTDDGGGGGEAAQTEFDVVLTSFGDKKLNVVKVVKNLTGITLMDAKRLVEGIPATIKEKVSKEEGNKLKAELEEAGGSVELK